jgi:predicted ribosome quality control (RQC) complex YloA/Tae2 family protein
MKITYKKLNESVPAFQEFLELKFPPKIAEEIASVAVKVDNELELLEYKVDELTNTIEDVNRRDEQIELLMNEAVEIDIPQFSTDLIRQNVSPNLYRGLDWLLKKEKPFLKTTSLKVQ